MVKHSNAAFDTDHFSRSAQQVYSKAVIAHVRLATVGFASTLNAHPFTHDEWTFAHNGTIPSFEELIPQLEKNTGERYLNCRLGTTDSELFFLWLLYQLEVNGINSDNVATKADLARKVVAGAVASLAESCHEADPNTEPRLNFVLTNGHVLFACRWNNPMYWTERTGIHNCEVCETPHIHHHPTVDYRAVIIASEPITSEAWNEIPNHSLMHVSSQLTSVIDRIPHNHLVGK